MNTHTLAIEQTPVTEIMTHSVQTIGFRDSVKEALQLMLDGHNSLPVIDQKGLCVGVISRADLTEPLFEEDQELARLIDSRDHLALAASGTVETCSEKLVGELMSNEVVIATTDTTIKQASRSMTDKDIHHLPVVDDTGRVAGIVSSIDIIRWIADA